MLGTTRSTRTTRAAVAAAALLGAIGALPAHAAPVCNLVTDPAGDTFIYRTLEAESNYSEPAADIISADIASNGSFVTAVFRVKGPLTQTSSSSPGGFGYDWDFTTAAGGDVEMFLRAQTSSTGVVYTAGYRDATPIVTTIATVTATATGVFDTAKNEVRITAPLSAFAGQGGLKAGTKITPGELTAGRHAQGRSVFADYTAGGKVYTAGDASCVKVNA